MTPLLPEVAFWKALCLERQGRHPIAIGALLVTAWLSAATAAPLGADRQAPTKPPRSHGLKSQAPESQTLRLRFDNGLLSLHVSQRSFPEVLGAIQKETGIRFHYTLPMAEAVTLSFDDVPVPDALKRLLGPGADFICRYGRATDSRWSHTLPQEVWLLAGERLGSEALSNDGGDSAEESRSPSLDRTSDAGERLDEAGADSAAERREIDTLVELAEADDPAQRVQALSALGDSGAADDDTVRSTLEAALADRDASVRGQALQALAVRGGGEAMEHLRQALRDSDRVVRIVAVERVEPTDEGIALLEEALADADETVRFLAASRLEQAENQGDKE